LTHIPSGLIVTAQCRSRENSFDEAYSELVKRLQRETKYKKLSEDAKNRKEQVGSGMRGDKKRTYRFQDNIVSDENGLKAQTNYVLDGNFDVLWK